MRQHTSYLVLIISVVFLLIFLAVLYVCPAEPEQEKTAEDCVWAGGGSVGGEGSQRSEAELFVKNELWYPEAGQCEGYSEYTERK